MKRKLILILAILIILLLLIKRKDMTWRQSILKAIYPIIMLPGKLFGSNKEAHINEQEKKPVQDIYALSFQANNKDTISMEQFRGKKILIVNTASNCGYTGQFAELETLHQQYKDQLQIIGFPANDFKEQEKGNDEEIARFCKVNFGVSFLLASKTSVIRGQEQHPLYKWLSQASLNGWNNQEPVWNFCKYLVDENGTLLGFFSQKISPLDEQIRTRIEK